MVRHRTSQLANNDNVVGLCSTAAAVLFLFQSAIARSNYIHALVGEVQMRIRYLGTY